MKCVVGMAILIFLDCCSLCGSVWVCVHLLPVGWWWSTDCCRCVAVCCVPVSDAPPRLGSWCEKEERVGAFPTQNKDVKYNGTVLIVFSRGGGEVGVGTPGSRRIVLCEIETGASGPVGNRRGIKGAKRSKKKGKQLGGRSLL